MNRRNHPGWRAAPVLLALSLALSPGSGRAQPVVVRGGFKSAEYYDPPHETQMKSMLEGSSAERQPDGRVLVTNARRQTFLVNGEVELTVEAPQCLYDSAQRTISSAGPLLAKTGDGKFSIEGEGFLAQQTNSILLVSNRVHTVLRPAGLSPSPAATRTNAPTAAASGINIYSDQFAYSEKSGVGVYQGHVRVAGTNLTATAARLTIVLPLAEHRVKSLLAETNVIVDYESIHATGARATYSADTGLIHMTGQPTWRVEDRDGRGDELVFDRTNRIFQANGHARMKLPARSMGASGFLAAPASASAPALPLTNQFVEIQCGNYILRTNVGVFHDQVRVSDRLGSQLRGQMTCGLMTLTFTGTNELRRMVAEHSVVISQTESQFTADNAVYTATNGLLDLTGHPTWRTGTREGQGDLVRANPAREEMLVRGNAVMKLPAVEMGQTTLTGLGKPRPAKPKGGTNEFARIFSDVYLLTTNAALFRGHVRIEHPQLKETCEVLTMLTLPELGKDGRMIIAEPSVVFDVVDDQGRNFHGTGEKAVYTHSQTITYTNDVMKLTGRPAMLETTNVVGRNDIIILDLASHTLTAPGKYNLRYTPPPGTSTRFRPPNSG